MTIDHQMDLLDLGMPAVRKGHKSVSETGDGLDPAVRGTKQTLWRNNRRQEFVRIMAMKIDVQRIPSQGLTLRYEKPAKVFASLKELSDRHEYEFISPIAIDLDVQLERDMIRVKGRVATTLRLACSRCLATFDSPLRNRFKLRYSREIPQDVLAPGVNEVELTADQIGLLFFKGDEIDLKDAIAEQVVLALPYKPLCDEACKGLCPRCGVDLNSSTCQCSAEPAASPFAVLKNLKLT